MYAIIKTGGKQYTVKPGEYLDVEKLEGKVGDKVDVEVLFVNDGKKILTGSEAAKAKVVAEIVDQHKGDKVIVFKFKKRKGYKRTRGHRQQLTRIAITEINGVKGEVKKAAKKADKPAKKADKKADSKKAETKKVEAKKEEKPAKKAEKPAEKKADKKPAEKKAEKKVEAKKETANVDYAKMTVAQLKEVAKEKNVKIPSGAKKADIIELVKNA